MKRQQILVAAILIIVSLTGAVQGRKFIGSLRTTDGDSLAEQDGRLVLVRERRRIAPRIDDLQAVWKIGSHYLQTDKGTFLALKQSQDGVKVLLAEKTGESTKWVIEVLETTSPQRPTKGSIGEKQMLEGTSKSKFRLIVFDGRYKGWYLAAKVPTQEQAKTAVNVPLVLDFQVVQNPKQALTFDYVDTSYEIHHKSETDPFLNHATFRAARQSANH